MVVDFIFKIIQLIGVPALIAICVIMLILELAVIAYILSKPTRRIKDSKYQKDLKCNVSFMKLFRLLILITALIVCLLYILHLHFKIEWEVFKICFDIIFLIFVCMCLFLIITEIRHRLKKRKRSKW